MSRPKPVGSGRNAGTPNKRTRSFEEKLEALGCDPIEAMARLAMDENESSTLRFAAMKELAQYVAPKRKAVELSSSGNQVVFMLHPADAML